jgi:hypothetical protein
VPDPSPWTGPQLRVAVGLGVVGLAALLAAWWGSAGASTLSDQAGWLSLATAGTAVGLTGAGALFLFGHRAIARRRRRLLGSLLAPVTSPNGAAASGWVWVPGTVRAHRASCPLAAGKAVRTVDGAEIRRRGLRRCEVCGS